MPNDTVAKLPEGTPDFDSARDYAKVDWDDLLSSLEGDNSQDE